MFPDYLIWLSAALLLAWGCLKITEPIHCIVLGAIACICFIIAIALTPWYLLLLMAIALFILA